MFTCTHLGVILVFDVYFGHALEPGPPEFRGGGVALREAVLQVDQHLLVVQMFLHLRRGHQHRPDPLRQVLHLNGKHCLLQDKTMVIRKT